MKPQKHRPSFAVLLTLLVLAGCSATKLNTLAQLPPPLIDKLPVRVGIHYSKEFSEYIHKETRSQIDYEVTLGPAHVTNLDWLLGAMFAEVVRVDDPTRVGEMRPPLLFVLEPKFEEYSFLTPKDVAGEAFVVTIRYLLTLYDGDGSRVDAFTYTGYGREKSRTLASKEPLAIATQRAMRDAGAKVAVELVDQDSVRLLLRNPSDPMPGKPAVQMVPVSDTQSTPASKSPPPPQTPPPAASGEPPAATTELPPETAKPVEEAKPAEETKPEDQPAPAEETPPPGSVRGG
jgi:hypothetical protein